MPQTTSPLPPHRELTDYYAGDKRPFVRRVFDEGAGEYDRTERMMSLGSGRRYRREALRRAGLAEGMHALDVAVGTGLVAREAVGIVGEGGSVVGLDPSGGMLGQAAGIDGLRLVRGVGESLPFDDDAFDFLSMGYAIRHVRDLREAFGEFRRVLKPGGRVCILEMTPPRRGPIAAAMRLHLKHVLPTFSRLRGRRAARVMWQYYWDTMEDFVEPARVLDAMADAGLREAKRHTLLGLFSEYTAVAG